MSENDYQSEIEILKRQLVRERLLVEPALAKAEHKAYVQKNNDMEKLAWVTVLLFCAVVVILGLN